MAHHQTTVAGATGRWQGRCRCGERGPVAEFLSDAQGWGEHHMREVERARAHRRTRAPSLKDQRDYYRSRADDPSQSAEDRTLWAQLADGLDRRIGTEMDQQPLFPMEERP